MVCVVLVIWVFSGVFILWGVSCVFVVVLMIVSECSK